MADNPSNGDESQEAPDAQIDPAAALSYWSSIAPDVDGMLGGYGSLSRLDLQGSANFVVKLRRRSSMFPPSRPPLLARAVDCGAGIGRITQGLLAKVCEVVDLVEPVARFVTEVREGERMAPLRDSGKLGEVWQQPLEEWQPAPGRYTLVWNQWCLGHLKDAALVGYLVRCRHALQQGGWIVVKENMSTDEDGSDIFDPVDSSVTRWVYSRCCVSREGERERSWDGQAG